MSSQLNGRAMRLLVTPLIRALKTILGAHPFLVYMDTFRYPLAGEFALDVDLVRRVRLPCDWALEVGTLAEVFRNAAPRAICQSELWENYDHKHQELSSRDTAKGPNKMAVDIAKSFFRRMAAEGIKLDAGLFDTLLSICLRQAEDTLRFYAADAAMNGPHFPRHEEEMAVNTFVRSIHAEKSFLEDPLWSPLIPTGTASNPRCPAFSTNSPRQCMRTTSSEKTACGGGKQRQAGSSDGSSPGGGVVHISPEEPNVPIMEVLSECPPPIPPSRRPQRFFP